jgi:hypothetical protein
MAQWLNGSMAQWLNGSMDQWINGSMAQWLNGLNSSMAQWLKGSKAQWAQWINGSMDRRLNGLNGSMAQWAQWINGSTAQWLNGSMASKVGLETSEGCGKRLVLGLQWLWGSVFRYGVEDVVCRSSRPVDVSADLSNGRGSPRAAQAPLTLRLHSHSQSLASAPTAYDSALVLFSPAPRGQTTQHPL